MISLLFLILLVKALFSTNKFFIVSFDIINIIFLILLSKHSSNIISSIYLLPNGHNSFGTTLVNGNILVPRPAKGII